MITSIGKQKDPFNSRGKGGKQAHSFSGVAKQKRLARKKRNSKK